VRWSESCAGACPWPAREAEDLGQLDLGQLMKAAEKACDPADSMTSMPFEVTPKMVLDAMHEVDRLGSSMK